MGQKAEKVRDTVKKIKSTNIYKFRDLISDEPKWRRVWQVILD